MQVLNRTLAAVTVLFVLSACTTNTTPSPNATATRAAAPAPTATQTAPAPTPQPATPAILAATTLAEATPSATPALASTPSAAPTACAAKATPAQTEGPYYLANPPAKDSLVEPGMAGTRVTLRGRVFDLQCRPIAGAKVDVWQADAAGAYDLKGYRLRGVTTADAQGAYSLATIRPGLYPGRTSHIHVKVWLPNGKTLTTQVYFPGVAANNTDGIYDAALLAAMSQAADGSEIAELNFFVAP